MKIKAFSLYTWIFVLGGILIMFTFPTLIPTWSTVTESGEVVLFAFIGLLLIVIGTGNLIWPIFIAMFSLVIQGFIGGNEIVTGLFSNATIILMLGMFVLAWSLNESGFGYVVARFLLTRKFMNGKPLIFTMIMFLAIYLMSIFINIFGTLMFGLPLVAMVCKQAGYDTDSHYYKASQVGVYMFATMGSMVFPFSNGMVLASLNSGMAVVGQQLDSAAYTTTGVIVTLVFIVIYSLVIKFIFRIDMEKISSVDPTKLENLSQSRVTKRQVVIVLGFFVAVAYSFVAALLPDVSALGGWLGNITQALWFCFIVAILCIVHLDGKPVLDINTALKEGVDWPTLFAIGGFVLLSGYIGQDSSGIFAWLKIILEPILGSVQSFYLLMLAVCLIVMLISNFFSNMMTSIIVGTIIAPFMGNFPGVNPSVIMAAIVFCSWNTFLTPAANGTAPILLGYEGIDNKFIWTRGLISTTIYAFLASILFTFLAYIL